jgi:hypothetical protein
VVTSDFRKVGKTYSKDLVDYVAAIRPLVSVAYIDLDTLDFGENANDSSARLASVIAGKIGRAESPPNPGMEQAPRGNAELVQWLIPDAAPAGGKVWWILLDGFRDKHPPESVQEFVSQLAQRVQGAVCFGLILLNYELPLPLNVAGFAAKEKVKPIAKTDVERFLSRMFEETHNRPPTAVEIGDYVAVTYDRHTEYTQKYPESAEDQLLLNMAVADAAEIILEGVV